MTFPKLAANYRQFRLSKINQEEYRHLWLLLFWPAYILRYIIIENLNPAAEYVTVWCPLDDWIPFQEGFLIFYVMWYVFIVGMHLYTLLFDITSFRRYTKFLVISILISTATFLLFPTCQELRPAVFPRDNYLTRLVQMIYSVDTSTNVCPSEHVIGSVAVLLAAFHTKSLCSPGKLTAISVLAVLISVSTVFLKQHSVVDIIAALPVCVVAYILTYGIKRKTPPGGKV